MMQQLKVPLSSYSGCVQGYGEIIMNGLKLSDSTTLEYMGTDPAATHCLSRIQEDKSISNIRVEYTDAVKIRKGQC